MSAWRACVALAVLTAACAGGTTPAPAPAEPPRARAAIASLVVENRTPRDLQISYRLTSATAREVGVGRVGAGVMAATAPVPAAEPVILMARADSLRFVLPARTFEIGGSWTWVIPADAAFTAPDGTR